MSAGLLGFIVIIQSLLLGCSKEGSESYKAALERLNNSDTTAAVELLHTALKKNRSYTDAYLRLAEIQAAGGNYDSTLYYLEIARERYRNDQIRRGISENKLKDALKDHYMLFARVNCELFMNCYRELSQDSGDTAFYQNNPLLTSLKRNFVDAFVAASFDEKTLMENSIALCSLGLETGNLMYGHEDVSSAEDLLKVPYDFFIESGKVPGYDLNSDRKCELFKKYHQSKMSSSIERAMKRPGDTYLQDALGAARSSMSQVLREAQRCGIEKECSQALEEIEERLKAIEFNVRLISVFDNI